jgi:hypothetical protein
VHEVQQSAQFIAIQIFRPAAGIEPAETAVNGISSRIDCGKGALKISGRGQKFTYFIFHFPFRSSSRILSANAEVRLLLLLSAARTISAVPFMVIFFDARVSAV